MRSPELSWQMPRSRHAETDPNGRTGQKWNEHTFRHAFAETCETVAKDLPAEGDQPALESMMIEKNGRELRKLDDIVLTRHLSYMLRFSESGRPISSRSLSMHADATSAAA